MLEIYQGMMGILWKCGIEKMGNEHPCIWSFKWDLFSTM
jgi:hypothetical protein